VALQRFTCSLSGCGSSFLLCFCVGIAQACRSTSGIAEARGLHGNVRNAGPARFRDVFRLGPYAFVIVLPTALIRARSGAPTRLLGGTVFSTAAALTVLPVLIARIKG